VELVIDTLKRGDKDLYVTGSIDRQHVYAMQTPQIFARDILEEAYQAVAADKLQITDEVSAVEYLGRKVALVPNDDFNFKITYERDLRLAGFVLRERAQRG
jgi:2-C-methyl-D-erythritol 4-phosphate cytidylyltransferase